VILIAVCDDNYADRTRLCNAIEICLKDRNIDGKVFVFDSAEKLNSFIENQGQRFDLVFLDIIMGDMNGIACARLIRCQDKIVQIVFLTTSTYYVYDGYEVNASAYLVKPLEADKLAAILDKSIAKIEDAVKESIVITTGRVTQRILIQDILYLESRNNKLEVVLARTGQRRAVYTTLDGFEQSHPVKMLIRCHKSYIVNFLYIEQYASDKFVLRDGAVIPISRIYKDKARDHFFTQLHNQ
jgi:two-component system, LytTR family, response regulator LytT